MAYVPAGMPAQPTLVSPQIAMLALQVPAVGPPPQAHVEQSRKSLSELNSTVLVGYAAGHATPPL